MARSADLLRPLGEALFRQPVWPDHAALARHLGTTPSALSPWLNHLAFHRAVRETEEGLHAQPDRLLHVLTAHRLAELRPEAPMAIALDAAELHAALSAEGVPHAFAMFTAANAWAFFEPRQDIHVYLPRAALPALRRLAQPRTARARGSATLQAYAERVGRLPTADRGGFVVTAPLQTVLDLRAHPEGGAHAAFLQEHLLPRLRGAPA